MAEGVFTTADLEELKTNIMRLASGDAQLVSISGRMYRKSNLDELRRMYEWMKGQVLQSSTAGVRRIAFGTTSNQDGV